MVTLRKRPQIVGTSANPSKRSKTTEEISNYEQCRDQRIKENMERMQKLGILDLSLKLKSELLPPPKRSPRCQTERKTPQRSPLLSLQQPTRRSSRLQNVTPVTYTEVCIHKKEKLEGDEMGDLVGEGSKPEIYTEEHEKMLGTCNATWNLFVDGVGKDGKRIYDPVKGKTCHQCRQKTLGHRTHCIKCNLVQGQFCGDCLYMRYGENVLEANQNSSWICPVCRGICNCSLCRQAKGWPPTGSMYRKITKLGFKSVAHYLIETRRSQAHIKEEDQDTVHPVSAKRSLPFADTEEPSEPKETLNSDENLEPLSEDTNKADDLLNETLKAESQSLDSKDENTKPSSVYGEDDHDPLKVEKAEISATLNSKHEVRYVALFVDGENDHDPLKAEKAEMSPTFNSKSKVRYVTCGSETLKVEKAEISATLNSKHEVRYVALFVDGENDHDPLKAEKAEMSPTFNSKSKVRYVTCGSEMKLEMSSSRAIPDSIAGRLRQRRSRT